jgi:branched-chain amino acid transport system substrate-binding protein
VALKGGREMKKSFNWGMITFLFLGLALTTLSIPREGVASDPGITKDQITVGAYLGYSSPVATTNFQIEAGVMSYLNAINEAGGIYGRKVKWIGEDDGYQPTKTLAACKKLIEQDKIFALLSAAGIPTTFAALPYIESQNVPLLCPYAPILSLEEPPRRNVFMITPSAERQYYFIVDYAIKKLGAKRISIIGQAGPKGPYDYMAYRLKESGLTQVGDYEEYKIGQTDFSAIIAKFKQVNPDFMIVGTIGAPGSLILKEAQKQGLRPALGFMSHSTIYDLEFIRLAGNAGEGVRTLQIMKSPTESMDPEVVEFRERLEKYYPKKITPSLFVMHGYVSAKIFCEAMKKAGPDPTREKLITSLESMTGFDVGFMRPLSFSPTQHLGSMFVRVNQLQGGKYVPTTDWVSLSERLPSLK